MNQLVIPVGRPVHFSITSASVFNSFFIPRLGSQIYAMNGMVTQLNLQADRRATLLGMSAHFSGDGFPGMHFRVNAVDPTDFASWVARAGARGPMLDTEAYRVLLRQSSDEPAETFRDPAAGLFDAVVAQALPPGPGPAPTAVPNGKSW